jgi:uncharacterized protein involved in exopolysaccharide biosynthesis
MREIFRRRSRSWILLGFLVFTTSVLGGLFLYPQSFTSIASIAMQQQNSAMSPLASLAGIGAQTKKYTGILKSHRFAEQVERVVDLKNLYHLDTHEDAIKLLQKSAKFDDNTTDGLLYITLSLDGPPRLALNASSRRDRVKQAVALATNTYATALKEYLKTSDDDRETVMLRAAEVQMQKARNSYEQALQHWIQFYRRSRVGTGMTGPSATGGSTGSTGSSTTSSDASVAISQFSALHVKKAQLEAQIKSLDTSISATHNLLNRSMRDLTGMPTEDPLLTEARDQVNKADTALKGLEAAYGDENPQVRRAKERLNIAEKQLHTQVQAILQGHSSDQIKRAALQAEYDTVVRQVSQADREFQFARTTGTQNFKLQNEVGISLEVLKATATHYAELKLSSISAQNRMTVVDEGRRPDIGFPGILVVTLFSVFLAPAAIFVWAAAEYVLLMLKASALFGGEAAVQGPSG